MEGCKSLLSGINISYENETIKVSGVAKSPIVHAGPISFVPSELQEHYETKVTVNLEIKEDSNVSTEQKVLTIPYSQGEEFNFEFNTTENKTYEVRVYTSLENETKCVFDSSLIVSSNTKIINTTNSSQEENNSSLVILGIKTYSDDDFSDEETEFLRGENVYVKVELNDSVNNITKMLIDNIELTKIKEENKSYYFVLEVPKNFSLGESYELYLEVNSNSSIEEMINLTIKNNLPDIGNLPEISVKEGKTYTLNLLEYAGDFEDNKEDLIWNPSSSSSKISFTLNGKNLQIKGKDEGDATITLRVTDNDGGYSEKLMNVKVEKSSSSKSSSSKSKDTSYVETNNQNNVQYYNYVEEDVSEIRLNYQVQGKEENWVLFYFLFLLILILILLILIYLLTKKQQKNYKLY
jgi:hypothetical protein